MNLSRLALFAFFALWTAGATAQQLPVLLHFKVYTSPSKQFQFEVDPTERYGSGPGNCKLTEKGSVLWEASLPFAFHDVLVADDGTVAGYGYTTGSAGSFSADEGKICVAIFGPDGTRRLEEKFDRRMSGLIHGGLVPWAGGIFFSENRFTIRISDHGPLQQWHSYRLSDGKLLGEITPPRPALKESTSAWIYNAVPVAGTPLALLHWWFSPGRSDDSGAIFTLIEPDGTQVWEFIAPGDYHLTGEEHNEHLHRFLRREGAIFKTTGAGKFDLWLARSGERVLFSVERDAGKWRVAELSRRPHPLPAPPALEKLPEVPEPEKLGAFTLDTPSPKGPVHDVSTFGFDDKGRIGFLRGSEHFVLIDKDGALLAEVALSLPDDQKGLLAWISGDRWLVTASGWGKGEMARAWWIDVKTKTAVQAAGFDCPPIEAIAGTGDGGFVALSDNVGNSGVPEILIAFDAKGKRRWEMKATQGFTPDKFFSPENVVVTSRGEIAVLDNIRNTVHLYDLGGKHLRTVDLEKAWKREPEYTTGIIADAEGGFIVGDLFNKPPFVWMKADGSVRAELAPQFKDGGFPDKYGELRVDPDDRLWLNNRHNFVRLGDDGMIDASVGTSPDADALGIIGIAACDSNGRIHLADDQTGTVHVFDSGGRRLHVCKPEKSDVDSILRDPNLVATDTGRVFLRQSDTSAHFVIFGAEGTRERAVPAGKDYDQWYSRRGTGGILIRNFDKITLTDDGLAPVRKIERWPDRKWIDFAVSVAVADDGSFVVLGGRKSGQRILGFFSPKGDPERMVKVPFEWYTLAGWNGRHLVVSDKNTSIICDREGKPVRLLRLPVKEGEWAQFVTREGRELWVLRFGTRTVTRYAMPAGVQAAQVLRPCVIDAPPSVFNTLRVNGRQG